MKISLAWSDFKTQLSSRGLVYSYLDLNNNYYIYAIDGNFAFECLIPKTNNSDQTDFETNYKSTAASTFSQFDIDGASIVRQKAAKKGWSFWALPPEITTSTIGGSLYCKDSSGNDVSGFTCKIYDSNGNEITTPGILNANLNTCVKTVLDFEPSFDYEIIGGSLRITSNPSQDVRLWIVGAPDIPAQYGGSKEFASGINLKYLAPNASFDVDGRVTKYIASNLATHQGKLRIMLLHPAGLQVNMQFVIHLYRL